MTATVECLDEISDAQLLDVETSAALLRWMETAEIPDGIPTDLWERWVGDGCRKSLHADALLVTPAMLGQWARSGPAR